MSVEEAPRQPTPPRWNPYDATALSEESRWGKETIGFALILSGLGYLAPLATLLALTGLLHGETVALEMLVRVGKMHVQPSLSSVVGFLPNIVMAILAARIAWVSEPKDVFRWWTLLIATWLGYTIALSGNVGWGLIPWTWDPLWHNALISAFALSFPIIVSFGMQWRKRDERSKQSKSTVRRNKVGRQSLSKSIIRRSLATGMVVLIFGPDLGLGFRTSHDR